MTENAPLIGSPRGLGNLRTALAANQLPSDLKIAAGARRLPNVASSIVGKRPPQFSRGA